jgi:uncharacterized membrane protein
MERDDRRLAAAEPSRGLTLGAGVRAPVGVSRIESIDLVRGAIMILMALDHTRDFFGVTAVSPTDLSRASAPLFFTRWITHICAPGFFLLTGTGAALTLGRCTPRELAWFLVSRGAWLIVLELTIVRCLGFQFNFDYRVTLLLVLWALGWAMIALAPLVFLRPAAVAAVGVLVIATHNLLDGLPRSPNPVAGALQAILHGPGMVVAGGDYVVFAAYPLIPWIGVTAVGYALGTRYRAGINVRPLLLWAGLASCAAFVALRWINVYGDPAPWSAQPSALRTVLSFLNTTKYPPSLLFLLMTLGPAALLLRAAHGPTPRALLPLLQYGRVPLFYFVLHLALIHALAIAVCYARYGTAHWMFESPSLDRYPFTTPPGWGYSLPIVYAVWIAVVGLLYLPCRWYASIKARRRHWWFSYL